MSWYYTFQKEQNKRGFITSQIEDKVLRTEVSKGFSLCKVV